MHGGGDGGRTRQARYAARLRAAGRCVKCGRGRGDCPSTCLCRACLVRARRYTRAYQGSDPWRPGARGKPGLTPD